jgi:geranylgeranyl reductase family protein
MVDNLFDAVVIGASAIGSRTAKLIAGNGYNVLVIEEHKKIGLPSKCTGLVSHRLLEQLPNLPKKIIINKIKSARFFSPNGNSLELKSKKQVYVIDRTALDNFLFNEAKDSGVEIRTGERFESFRLMEDYVKIKTNKKIYHSKILIGADGVNSLVRKYSKLGYPKNVVFGLQTTVKGNFDSEFVELWFGSSVAPNFFAWVVPENNYTARVGLATDSNPMKFYNSFLKKRVDYIGRPNTTGIIRYGLMKETSFDRVMLVGDAALQTKPFSGGGIIYGLIASEICADAVIKALKKNRFDKKFFKQNYDRKWKEKLSLPIIKGLMLRKIFNKLPDKGLSSLFYFTGYVKRFLEKWDMDLL